MTKFVIRVCYLCPIKPTPSLVSNAKRGITTCNSLACIRVYFPRSAVPNLEFTWNKSAHEPLGYGLFARLCKCGFTLTRQQRTVWPKESRSIFCGIPTKAYIQSLRNDLFFYTQANISSGGSFDFTCGFYRTNITWRRNKSGWVFNYVFYVYFYLVIITSISKRGRWYFIWSNFYLYRSNHAGFLCASECIVD